MTLAQSVTAIIIFWAIIGGLGASLLLPAMQSLIHGNFEGAARTKTYALVGAAAAIAAGVGPLLGGFVTTYLSWRVGFGLEVVVIAVVLSQIKLVHDVAYTGPRQIDLVGAILSVVGMGGLVLGILVWQEGGEFVGLLIAIGAVALALLAYWLVRRKRAGKPTLLDPGLFKFPHFTTGISGQLLQNVTLGGAMIALPIFLQMTLEYNAMKTGLTLAPLSLSMFAVALLAGRKAGRRRPSNIILVGFALCTVGLALIIPIVPRTDSGWALFIPLLITGSGLGLLVSQLNNYTLSPIEEERASEAAGVNSAAGSFGLSFGLAMAGGIMLAFLAFSFTNQTEDSKVIPPAQQAADRRHARGRRRGHEQRPARAPPRRRARGRAGRDPPHQQGGARPLPPGRPARPRPRKPPRPAQRLPHETPPRPRAGQHRRRSSGLTAALGVDIPEHWGSRPYPPSGTSAELPVVHLDVGVPVRGQDGACRVRVRRPDQHRRAQPGGAVVGQQRPVRDQLVPVRRHGEVGGLPRAEAEHQVPVAAGPAAGEVPHGAAQHVAPPAQQHVPVHAGLVVGLVEGERAGGGGIGQVDDVHAAGGRVAVAGEGRAAGDHLRRYRSM